MANNFMHSDFVSSSDWTYNATLRTYTITGDHIVDDDFEMNAQEKGATFVYNSGGKLCFESGADGVVGGSPITTSIIEESGAHRFGGDNFDDTGTHPSRISGDSTCEPHFKNVRWIVNTSSTRSDWDINRGQHSDGRSGPAPIFEGFYLRTQGTHSQYCHPFTSKNIVVRKSAAQGFGMRVESRCPVNVIFEFATSLNTPPEGLEAVENFDLPSSYQQGDDRPTSGGGSEAVVFLFNNVDEIKVRGLQAVSVACLNGSSSKKLILEDPKVVSLTDGSVSVGIPPRPNSSRRHGKMIIARSQEFIFGGAGVADSTTLYCDKTSTNAEAESATATTSGNKATAMLRTHVIGHNSTTQTGIGTYNWVINGWDFRKKHGSLSQLGTGATTAVSTTTTSQAWPDASGTPSALTGTTGAANIDELYRRIQEYEIANRLVPAYNKEIAFFNTDGALEMDGVARIKFADGGSNVSHATSGGVTTITAKCLTTMARSSKGITKLLQPNRTISKPANFTLNFAITQGASGSVTHTSQVTLSASDNSTYLGASKDFAGIHYAGSPQTFITSGTLKVAATRAGKVPQVQELDTSSGGSYEVAFPSLLDQKLADGTNAYKTDASVADITATFSGATCKIDIGNAAKRARDVYKKFHDSLASVAGANFMALGGANLGYNEDFFAGDALYLNSADTQLRRAASTDSNSAVQATIYPASTAVDGANGEVHRKIGLDAASIAAANWNAALSSYTATGSAGKKLGDQANAPSASDNADAVLNRATSAVSTANSIGVHLKGLNNFQDQDFSDTQLSDIAASAAEGVLDANPVNHNDDNTIGKAIETAGNYTIPSAAPNAAAIETACEAAIEDKKAAIATAILGAANSSTDTTKVGGQVKAAANYTIPTPISGSDIQAAIEAKKGDIADAVEDALTIPGAAPDTTAIQGACEKAIEAKKGAIADSVADEPLSGHTTAGTLAKKLADLENADSFELTQDNLDAISGAVEEALNNPTKEEIATAVANTLDLPDQDWVNADDLRTALNTALGSQGSNVAVDATSIKAAVAGIEILPGVKLRGALKLALAQLIGGAKLEMRDSGNVNQPAKVPWLVFKSLDGATKLVEVKLGSENGERLLANVLPADINDAPQ